MIIDLARSATAINRPIGFAMYISRLSASAAPRLASADFIVADGEGLLMIAIAMIYSRHA